MKFYLVILLCTILSLHGVKKKSLSTDGAIAAFIVGIIIFSHPDITWSLILIGFYLSGSILTKIGAQWKKKYEESYIEGGQRNSIQVLANGLTGAVLSLVHRSLIHDYNQCKSINSNVLHWILFTGYLAHFACCNGDTWASEIGILSKNQPILITSLKKVPRGTNGGISILGLFASIMGGCFLGVIAALSLVVSNNCNFRYYHGILIIFIGGVAGITGSLIDSILGATLQKTVINKKTGKVSSKIQKSSSKLKTVSGLDILDNDQVNFIASFLTTVIMSSAMYLFIA